MQLIKSLAVTCLFFASSFAFAGSIVQIKGSKALIHLDGTAASPGSEFYAMSPEGKRKAIMVIKQVKGNTAIADITKGAAGVGFTLQEKGGAAAASTSNPTQSTSSSRRSNGRGNKAIGFFAGMTNSSMALSVQNKAGTVKQEMVLVDSSFSVKGFFDYDLGPMFTIRGATGLETFAVKGETTQNLCGNDDTKACAASFNYLAFEGAAHWNFVNRESFRMFVGLGYSLLMEMSKTNNISNLNSGGSTNQVVLASFGTDIGMGRSFIPIVAEYGYFPGTSNVTASAIYVRGGYGFSF